jgi:mannose-1-phosphate guanylyltransferase
VARRSPEDVIVMMPADHVVEPAEGFCRAGRAAADVASRERCLVTMGIVPRFPATGYGYIHRGEEIEGEFPAKAFRVREFREKPDEETARRYVDSGEFYWNSGVFAWRADVILEEIRRSLPGHRALLEKIAAALGAPAAHEVLGEVYPNFERVSIDYGVMEKASSVAVVEAEFEWDDVGCWTAFADHVERDPEGNAVEGEFLGLDCCDNVVVAPEGKLVAAVGLSDAVIIDTPDALLVCPRSRDQDVKKIVAKLKETGRTDLL